MVALGGTLTYISPGTLAYWKNVFIPIQVCSRTHVYQKTLPEFLSVFPVRYNSMRGRPIELGGTLQWQDGFIILAGLCPSDVQGYEQVGERWRRKARKV
jgi:hypothetical protein